MLCYPKSVVYWISCDGESSYVRSRGARAPGWHGWASSFVWLQRLGPTMQRRTLSRVLNCYIRGLCSMFTLVMVVNLYTASNRPASHRKRVSYCIMCNTSSIFLQDEWRAHSSTLMSYFMAEGVACQHQILHHTLDPGRTPLQQTLPALAVKGSSKAVEVKQDAPTPTPETELKIAWQYRRYVAPPSLAAVDTCLQTVETFILNPQVHQANRNSCYAHEALSIHPSCTHQRLTTLSTPINVCSQL